MNVEPEEQGCHQHTSPLIFLLLFCGMPGSERAGTKADGGSGLCSLQPGPSSSRERRKAASRHKRHRAKHSRDSPGVATQPPLTKVKSLVEYDDISFGL